MNETMLLKLPELRPVLYTDTVKGEQVCRDDLWAVSTGELNAIHAELTRLRAVIQLAGDVEGMTKAAHNDPQCYGIPEDLIRFIARALSAWLLKGGE